MPHSSAATSRPTSSKALDGTRRNHHADRLLHDRPEKLYRYVAEVGLNQPMQLTLANYRNQMGLGQVNAARLLNAVSGNGKQVSFPNLYISLGKEVKAIPANYFLGGETLTYTVSIADTRSPRRRWRVRN